VRALKRAGGDIRLEAPVTRILLEGKRAIGVQLADGTELRAKQVISNADPHITYERLVGVENLGAGLRRKLSRTRYSLSCVSLFLAVDRDLRAAGMDSGNIWYYARPDIESAYRGIDDVGYLNSPLPAESMFLTATTLKDPSKRHRGHHTMEALLLVRYEDFERWQDTQYEARPEAYAAFKEHLKAKVLRTIGQLVPGIEEDVVFAELGTPLTNVHYAQATRGNMYGIEKGLWQVGPLAFQQKGEIKGLTLCGASTLGHGVMGATLSGLMAASLVQRVPQFELLGAGGPALQIYPSEDPAAWPARLRRRIERGSREEQSVA
jgi:phytoene dehydrogenase-like protein